MNYIDFDALGKVFSYVPPHEVGPLCEVNQKWQTVGSSKLLWQEFREQYPFTDFRNVWTEALLSRYWLSIAEAPNVDERTLIGAVGRMFPHVENNKGVTVLIIPKGLSFNKMVQIAKDHSVPIHYVWNEVTQQLGSTETGVSKIAIMTNNVLTGSRNQTVADQHEQSGLVGCEMPDVVSALALLVLTYMRASDHVRLYTDATYMRCQEKVDGWHLGVGGFSPSGVCVHNVRVCDDPNVGVGGLRQP